MHLHKVHPTTVLRLAKRELDAPMACTAKCTASLVRKQSAMKRANLERAAHTQSNIVSLNFLHQNNRNLAHKSLSMILNRQILVET